MTDKEIIIDGVDVAKCRNFTSEWDFNNCGHICKGTECKYKRLWYKKQLKRKEKECENLKRELQAQRNFTAQEQRKIYCVAYDESCKTGNDCKQKKCIFKDNTKLKQTLTEIKEIAKNMNKECFYNDFDCMNCDMQNGCTYYSKKQILQKISECEVNNE